MRRLRPKVFRTEPLAGSKLWALGIETWVQEYERHFPWGSQADGADRYFVLHLGSIDLQWRWAA